MQDGVALIQGSWSQACKILFFPTAGCCRRYPFVEKRLKGGKGSGVIMCGRYYLEGEWSGALFGVVRGVMTINTAFIQRTASALSWLLNSRCLHDEVDVIFLG